MKICQLIPALAAWFFLGAFPSRVAAVEPEGVAVAIVFDTSGSMKEMVRDSSGKSSSKDVIARRALDAVVKRFDAFATNGPGGVPRRVEIGLIVFDRGDVTVLKKFGPFDRKSAGQWAREIPQPSGGTPLGNALASASRAVMNSELPRKHILVITDGMNTVGPDPATVLPRLKTVAEAQHTALSVHFVAFDVDAKLFDPLKRLGATVVSAADETQLNSQLGFILEKKILLEEEEPAPQPKTH